MMTNFDNQRPGDLWIINGVRYEITAPAFPGCKSIEAIRVADERSVRIRIGIEK